MNVIKILFIEDNKADAFLLIRKMNRISSQLNFTHVLTLSNAIKKLNDKKFDIILLDMNLPDSYGITTFNEVNKICKNIPIIIISGYSDEDLAIQAVKTGAQEYILKQNLIAEVLHKAILFSIERKRYINELQLVNRKFEEIINKASDVIIVINDKNKIVEFNKKAEELFKISKEKAIEKGLLQIIPEQFKKKHISSIKKFFETGEKKLIGTGFHELTGRKTNGEEFPLEMTLSSIKTGERTLVTAIMRDISDRKEQEEKLRSTLNILERTGEMAKVGGFEFDIINKKSTHSKELNRLFGLPLDEEVGYEDAIKYFHPDDRAKQINARKLAIEKGIGYDLILRYKSHHGDYRYLRSNTYVEKYDGKPTKIIGTFQDVTENTIYEKELLRLKEAIHQSPSMVIITDLEGTIEYVNLQFLEVSGYSMDMVIGQNPRFLKTNYLSDEIYKELWDTISSGKTWSGEFKNKKKDGNYYYAAALIAPILDSNGKIMNYIGFETDVTEERIMKEQFMQSQKLEAIGQLAGGIAHDFRNVLSSILLNTDIIEDELGDNKLSEEIEEIRKSIQMANSIVNQLLTYSKKEETQLDIIKPVRVINDLKDWISRLIGSNIKLEINIWGEVSQVYGDVSKLRQVIINLIVNSKEAMPDGGKIDICVGDITITSDFLIKSKIKISTINKVGRLLTQKRIDKGDYVLISIKDTGYGIPHNIIDKIYDPYFTTKEKKGGTGLGLSTVFSIVKEFNGEIRLITEKNVGTEFILFFPKLDLK